MGIEQATIDKIFCEAIELENAQQRDSFVQRACAGDGRLQAHLQNLLEAHFAAGSFLDAPAPELRETIDRNAEVEKVDQTIGPYKLREKIGEGGMGVVFVAEQEEPVRRKVAIKIIKPGMDTQEVVARFEAERQALALMDHPNIAKVLDAGSTESGKPYFVMELVRGIAITEYCDQNNLSVRERLTLFGQACQAIQHAHQKGIIHRDVKPSNVLVTLHDGKPVPKVIDFGVAKAINQRLTERTIYTRFAQIIGTPMYMSPEQAEFSGLDIDTRTDVYSLGVLLYEILTGATPFDKDRLAQAACEEMRRIVREEDPPRPSTRISTLGATATAVSARRKTDPRGLARFLQGDLDIIIMTAIEKDRTRRYDSASALAGDVNRFLADEAILAHPPSLRYRVTKFARRNRVAMATSVLILATLILGFAATGYHLAVTRKAWRETAEANAREALTAVAIGDFGKAENAADVAQDAGISTHQVTILRGFIALNMGDCDKAIDYADQALADEQLLREEERGAAHALLAAAAYAAGDDDRWQMELSKWRDWKPATDADWLLKIVVTMHWDPQHALTLLRQNPKIDHSPVGLLVRGSAGVLRAIDQQDSKTLDDALQDLRYVRHLFDNTPISLFRSMQANAVAIAIAKRNNANADTDQFEKEGRRMAAKLAQFKDYPPGDYARWLFFRATGDVQESSRAIKRLGRHSGTYCFFLVPHLLRQHDPAAAIRAFDEAVGRGESDSTFETIARLHLLRMQPDGARHVREILDKLLSDDLPHVTLRYALLAFCLVGDPDEVRDRAARATKAIEAEAFPTEGLYDVACVTHFADQDDDKLLENAENGAYSSAIAHVNIAMLRLARRDRVGAEKHFREAVATNAIGSWDHELAQAYLARMEADEHWPHWLNAQNTD